MFSTKTFAGILAIIFTLSSWASPVNGQENDKKDLGWSFEGRLTSIWAGGNSASNTVGLSSVLKHTWPTSALSMSTGALRTESSLKTRQAVGTTDAFVINETVSTEKTAEYVFARTKYAQNVNDQFRLLAGLDWLRNTFSGIDSRFLGALGAGITLSDTEQLSASADLSFTYTFEEDVVDNPFSSGKFPGLRLGYTAEYQATENTTIESELVGDWNLDNSDDLRADWTNAVAVAINSTLALKPSTVIRWRNDPALVSVALQDSEGMDTGKKVNVALEKTDWFLNMAIVLTLK